MNADHNCIALIRKEIMDADPKVTSFYFQLSTIESMSDRTGIKKTGQAVEINYNHTKKDGSVVSKTEKSFV